MRFLWVPISAVLASDSSWPPNPATDAQVYFLIDLATWGEDRLDFANRMIAEQLPDLLSAFEQAGLTLEVAVGATGALDLTCFKHTLDMSKSIDDIDAALTNLPPYDVEETARSNRNIMNAVMHAAAANYFRKDNYTRRLITVITDDVSDFGEGNPVDPYLSTCPQTQPTAEEFGKAVKDAEVGLLFLIQIIKESESTIKPGRVRTQMVDAGITDFDVDCNMQEASWNGVSYHVSHLLSREYVASTSTTTIKTTSTSASFDPDRDAEVFFVMDASTLDTAGYHLSFAAQMCIQQLEDLFKQYASSGFTLSVGAATFGHVDGTCYKPLLSFTSDYTTVRKGMSNPPTYDANLDGKSQRNTYNALMYAASSSDLFSKSDTVRRLLVLVTDSIPPFGEGNDEDRSKQPICPQQQASLDQFRSALEDSRTGLLVTILSKDSSTGATQLAAAKKNLEETGLTDLAYNVDYDKTSWDAINYHVTLMLSSDWLASTSTTTKSVSERLKDCVAQVLDCKA